MGGLLRTSPHAAGAKIHGVNLGNWLVLERWMESQRKPGPFAGTEADDERGLRRELDPHELQQRLARHRSSYVTADTFAWLADNGCNLVRIPVPYHVFGDESHESCIEYLDQALDWAAASHLDVLIDLHTVPGGQNGFDNGGVSGLCTWHLTSEQVARTLDILERLAFRYAGHEALRALEPMNEPASRRIFTQNMKRYGANHPNRVERSSPIPHSMLLHFYQLVYERLRPILGPDVALVFHDQFELNAWSHLMPASRYPNVWIDTHLYVGTIARGLHLHTLRTHVAIIRALKAHVALASRYHPVLVGEWSLSNNVRKLSSADDTTRNAIYRTLATAQLAAFDQSLGSCFWSLRNASHPSWSIEAAIGNGWLNL